MKVLQHYGVDVVFQILEENFRDVLYNANIQYEELPLLNVDVIRYVKDGTTKYACIAMKMRVIGASTLQNIFQMI